MSREISDRGRDDGAQKTSQKKNASKLFLFPAEFGEMRTNFMVT